MANTMKQFEVLPKFGPENAQSIYVSHGSFLFLPGLKRKYGLLSNNALLLRNHVLSTLPTSFSPASNKDLMSALQKRNVICQFSCNRNSRYVAVLPKGCRKKLNSTSQNLSAFALLSRKAYFLSVGANLPPRLISVSCFQLNHRTSSSTKSCLCSTL